MTTLEEIEKAVSRLKPDEMARFRKWFDERDAALWDEQFERDANASKLDAIARQALSDHSGGRTKKL